MFTSVRLKWKISLPFHTVQLVKSLPFDIPEAWKRYPSRAGPPRRGHYRVPLGGTFLSRKIFFSLSSPPSYRALTFVSKSDISFTDKDKLKKNLKLELKRTQNLSDRVPQFLCIWSQAWEPNHQGVGGDPSCWAHIHVHNPGKVPGCKRGTPALGNIWFRIGRRCSLSPF